MIDRLVRNAAICLFASVVVSPAFAEEQMDVDLADSPNFEAFHKEKKDAIKIWTDEKGLGIQSGGEPEKVYQKEHHTGAAQTPTTVAGQAGAATAAPGSNDKHGKRYEIRELYSIGGSERTGYTPTTVVQALFLQMQGLCPKGWRKLDERSEPDGSDALYMYYAFECL